MSKGKLLDFALMKEELLKTSEDTISVVNHKNHGTSEELRIGEVLYQELGFSSIVFRGSPSTDMKAIHGLRIDSLQESGIDQRSGFFW